MIKAKVLEILANALDQSISHQQKLQEYFSGFSVKELHSPLVGSGRTCQEALDAAEQDVLMCRRAYDWAIDQGNNSRMSVELFALKSPQRADAGNVVEPKRRRKRRA